MILTVNVPDELVPTLNDAAAAAGAPDLATAVAQHIAALIRDHSRAAITSAAMQQVQTQVSQDLATMEQSASQISATCA